MSTARRTEIQIITTEPGVQLDLTRREASILMGIVGGVLGAGEYQKVTGDIYDTLKALNVQSARDVFEGHPPRVKTV